MTYIGCHAGLDPASMEAFHDGLRIKSAMTRQGGSE